MKTIETLHAMIKNVSALLTELTKSAIRDKAEDRMTQERKNRYIYEQATSIERWVESLDLKNY